MIAMLGLHHLTTFRPWVLLGFWFLSLESSLFLVPCTLCLIIVIFENYGSE